jgi:Methyltransferase domain
VSRNIKSLIKSVAVRLPFLGAVITRHDHFRRNCGFVPPGHFYSPIPSLQEIKRDEARVFRDPCREIRGIDLREQEQLELLKVLSCYYADQPFTAQKTKENRYYFENPNYSYSDAIMLHCMLRHLRPNRIIEIGSGFSSCVIFDTWEQFLEGSMDLTFIEPYPDLLFSLLREEDKEQMRVLTYRLQDVDLDLFGRLEADDILFIDSTHVAKINSDVNQIFFEILPRLKSGVHIHIHDIFFPFEYPKEWIYNGRAWNESYMLRAFLQFNREFNIVLMNTFMEFYHEPFFKENMPLCLKNRGASIWIAKT